MKKDMERKTIYLFLAHMSEEGGNDIGFVSSTRDMEQVVG